MSKEHQNPCRAHQVRWYGSCVSSRLANVKMRCPQIAHFTFDLLNPILAPCVCLSTKAFLTKTVVYVVQIPKNTTRSRYIPPRHWEVFVAERHRAAVCRLHGASSQCRVPKKLWAQTAAVMMRVMWKDVIMHNTNTEAFKRTQIRKCFQGLVRNIMWNSSFGVCYFCCVCFVCVVPIL